MNPKPIISFVALLILLAGCQGLNKNSDLPALIVEPNDPSRAALQATVSGLFGGYKVRLADDALTQSSLLILELGPQKKLSNLPANGRILTAPYRFRLIKNDDECTLIDLRNGSRHVLADTTCVPE
jgi:hypothetical protein